MPDHRDTPDPRADITDLYVFPASGSPDRSVLILNINPDASALEASFDPAASYEVKIDSDGDLEADVAFHVIFASSSDRGGTATVYRSTGAAARGTGSIGDVVISGAPLSVGGAAQVIATDGYRFFAGLRSDPFFLRLTDDVVDLMIAMVTMGRVATDGVDPHTDLIDEFPFLGAPHAVPV